MRGAELTGSGDAGAAEVQVKRLRGELAERQMSMGELSVAKRFLRKDPAGRTELCRAALILSAGPPPVASGPQPNRASRAPRAGGCWSPNREHHSCRPDPLPLMCIGGSLLINPQLGIGVPEAG